MNKIEIKLETNLLKAWMKGTFQNKIACPPIGGQAISFQNVLWFTKEQIQFLEMLLKYT
jgi:hypothetical protein